MDSSGRYALLVSSSRYSDPSLQPLRAPTDDAEALAVVLRDPDLGGFRVREIVDQPSWVIAEEVERFFSERSLKDVSLFYFSGHGIKDEDGALYFAAMNTQRQLLRSTAVPSEHMVGAMHRSRSRQQVLLLDCCFAGAFSRALPTKGDEHIDVQERFATEGAGRVVITASDAMQYAFVGEELQGEAPLSVFTSVLVEGIRSGEADQDRDGRVSLDELFDYVSEHVPLRNPGQTPKASILDKSGKIWISLANEATDLEAPTAPANLVATGGASAAGLSWASSSDNVAVARYDIYRSTAAAFAPSEANQIAQPTETSHTDFPPSPGTYYYRVRAEDAAGNLSEPSEEASARVGARTTVRERVRELLTARPRALVVAVGMIVAVAVAGVAFMILAPDDGSTILFEDDFSTKDHGWPNVGEGQIGGRYENGAYRILAERGVGPVIAAPANPPTANDVRISVDAHRVDGTSMAGYGYGIFCRAADPDNLYQFTVWATHARIEKRLDGQFMDLSLPASDVTSSVVDDPVKKLQAACTTVEGGSAVQLQLWVDGELKLEWTDRDDPLESGDYGLYAVVPGRGGETGESLEVEFDNFAIAGA